MRSEILKNHLELLVLTTLKAGPGHGYSIIRAIRDRSDGEFELLEGSLSPSSTASSEIAWSPAAGRTWPGGSAASSRGRKGRAALEQQECDWRRFERATNLVLAGR